MNNEAKFYPSIAEVREINDDIIFKLTRSPRSILGSITWSIFLFLIIIFFLVTFPDARLPASWPIMRTLSIPLLLLVPFGFALETARRYYDDLYIFEKNRVIHREGRLSIKSSVPAVHYRDVRAVVVIQSFVGRLLDYGSVELNTGALDLGELMIHGVRAPQELADLLDSLRRDSVGVYTPTDTFDD